jgi:hypothetical protein
VGFRKLRRMMNISISRKGRGLGSKVPVTSRDGGSGNRKNGKDGKAASKGGSMLLDASGNQIGRH